MSVFIVTGGSSGIGRATVIALASRGTEVVAVGRNLDRLHSLAERFPGIVRVVVADLSTDAGIDQVCEAVSGVDRINGIVHAAGSAVQIADYQNLRKIDLLSDFALHVAVPIELNNRLTHCLTGARILFLDSYSANSPRVGWAGYSIVKSAAQMAARAAAEEMKGSIVIRVFPGAVRTPLVEAVLNSTHDCPTVDTFRTMDREGRVSDEQDIGQYLSNILLDTSESELSARDYWDYGRPEDRIF